MGVLGKKAEEDRQYISWTDVFEVLETDAPAFLHHYRKPAYIYTIP